MTSKYKTQAIIDCFNDIIARNKKVRWFSDLPHLDQLEFAGHFMRAYYAVEKTESWAYDALQDQDMLGLFTAMLTEQTVESIDKFYLASCKATLKAYDYKIDEIFDDLMLEMRNQPPACDYNPLENENAS